MCVRIRREYRVEAINPLRVADFVAAALLSVLTPADWQVTADVELVAAQYMAALAGQSTAGTAYVEVVVHSTYVELVVGATDPGWVTEQVRLRPRRPFAATFDCELPAPRRPVPPRPVLWPALGRPRAESSWAETWQTLHEITQGIRLVGDDLAGTLDAVAAGVLTATTFTVAAVNVVLDDGDLQVLAIRGSDEARDAMLGVVGSRRQWDGLIDSATAWGTLCFASHDTAVADGDAVPSWSAAGDAPTDPDRWHPDDALIAPLFASDDSLLGVLSVDLPLGTPRPGVADLERLEVFAEHAASAIERARAPRAP